jgi:dephospho-CoA kinase
MRLNKNVWVDGSLRDAEWYDRVFKQIRRQHPHYSIAIIYVYASAETVFARARKRGEETGRFVAEEEILDSMRR